MFTNSITSGEVFMVKNKFFDYKNFQWIGTRAYNCLTGISIETRGTGGA
jgi:hypothetical protein